MSCKGFINSLETGGGDKVVGVVNEGMHSVVRQWDSNSYFSATACSNPSTESCTRSVRKEVSRNGRPAVRILTGVNDFFLHNTS